MGILVRLLLLFAGVVAGWFVPRDQVGYAVIEFIVVLILILAVGVAALYFPKVREFFRDFSSRR